jgi:hypothetical protein
MTAPQAITPYPALYSPVVLRMAMVELNLPLILVAALALYALRLIGG